MNIYYKIWGDLLSNSKNLPENNNSWKIVTNLIVSMAMAINLMTLLFLIGDLTSIKLEYGIKIKITTINNIDLFISFFISYLLPFMTINYIFIFYKKRYKLIVEKYPNCNGLFFKKYFVGSFLVLIMYFLIAVMIVKIFGIKNI